jgi:glycosyltransferase involved in cell wall biosynthesis
MEENIVSIIIPCFNHGAFLKEAIDSVLNSTYKLVEIIIVDDGSTDNTSEVAAEIIRNNPGVSYFYQANQGPSCARNKGISLAKGKFILPLDADDKISHHYIENALDAIRNNPKIVLVYCNAEYFGLKAGLWNLKEFSLKRLAVDNMIFSCALFRKEDWERVGGYSSELIGGWEDWEFWISILKTGGNVHKLDLTGFFYRIHHCSRRKSTTKAIERETVAFINHKHHDFIVSQLKGPLRQKREYSELVNFFYKFSL